METLVSQPWYATVGEIVVIANVITASLPSRFKGNLFVDLLMKALNFLAMNVFKNKNADDN